MIPPHARAVFFDAVGTVLHPVPDASTVYADAAARFGLCVDPAAISARFQAAFRRQEQADVAAGWVTNESREWQRWQTIVRESLPGASDECFNQLYQHFAKPESWRVPDRANEVFEALHASGLLLGLASNYDSRLMSVLEGRPELVRLRDRVIVSSVVGVRKPGAGFFVALVQIAGCPPDQVVYVGDDVENDFAGATAAGISAILLDPKDRHPNVSLRVRDLIELVEDRGPSLG